MDKLEEVTSDVTGDSPQCVYTIEIYADRLNIEGVDSTVRGYLAFREAIIVAEKAILKEIYDAGLL